MAYKIPNMHTQLKRSPNQIHLLANVVFLGYLGALTADATILGIPAYLLGQLSTVYYFGFFIVILPLLSKYEKAKQLPNSISEAVLEKK